MFFSIIIPVYNAEKYLDQCISSIINQSEKDFELLLVDDGSSDSSPKICDTWVTKYPGKIQALHKVNQGALFARRVGINAANGEFIWIVDADDYLPNSNVLSYLKSMILQHDCDLVFFNATDNLKTKLYDYSRFSDQQVFQGKEKYALYELMVKSWTFNNLWNKVFRKNLVDLEADYSQYTHIVNGNDIFQLYPIVTRAKKVLNLDSILYYYREVSGSIVHRFNSYAYHALQANTVRMNEYIQKWQVPQLQNYGNIKYLGKIATVMLLMRYIPSKEMTTKGKEYLESIHSDDMFQNTYRNTNKAGMHVVKRIFVTLLYHKHFAMIILLLKLANPFRA